MAGEDRELADDVIDTHDENGLYNSFEVKYFY